MAAAPKDLKSAFTAAAAAAKQTKKKPDNATLLKL
jgi:acyl-CoA-binding protein